VATHTASGAVRLLVLEVTRKALRSRATEKVLRDRSAHREDASADALRPARSTEHFQRLRFPVRRDAPSPLLALLAFPAVLAQTGSLREV